MTSLKGSFFLLMIEILSQSFSTTATTMATTTTTSKATPLTLKSKPSITNFLVFSSDSETVINFDPKSGWLLEDEKKLHLVLSGFKLENASIVFTASSKFCKPNDFISPMYPLSGAPIIELDIRLTNLSRVRSPISLCLLPFTGNRSENTKPLEGPYFTFIRESSAIPFPVKICLILMLFIVSGFFSGLNLGLMSLSVNDLNLIAESEDVSLRFCAKRVLPLRKRGNVLLCAIVLANVLVNSLGTVLLDSLVHGLFAVIGSTVMIVLMGEIIPQAICSRYGLIIGAHTHLITWGCMIITGIISYPLGFILDKILGQEVTASYTRDQIAGMLSKVAADIEKPELDVITGVLSLRKKMVQDAMTRLPDVYMLDEDRKTDAELLLDVHKHGFSRIPVYSNDRSNVVGIVKLRDFALITPEQYNLTVKNLMEFHAHPFGYTKSTDSLYDLLQEFLKARWHIAMVRENNDENEKYSDGTVAGIITLEDVIEEMLQCEIIEEADFVTDNRRKIQRKRKKNNDYTALVKRTVKGPSISPQLKVAVYQFLSTNVQQFTTGFISQEILQTLLNCNVYATIKRPTSPSTNANAIYLYKKDLPYELFTLITQGNATLESGSEKLMSTVGPFSFFATSALLADNKTVKDVHEFLDQLSANADKSEHTLSLLDEISPTFVPDYNLIVNSEVHVLQIHRLVWLAAVRATQRQRCKDLNQKRSSPEDLFSNALDEMASITDVFIDKNNLTNFQQIFHNEGDLTRLISQVAKGNLSVPPRQETPSSVFDAVHGLDTTDQTLSQSMLRLNTRAAAHTVLCNPLLLAKYDQNQSNAKESAPLSGNTSTNSTAAGSNASISIREIFNDGHDHMTHDAPDHDHENEHLLAPDANARRRAKSASSGPKPLAQSRSDYNIPMNLRSLATDEASNQNPHANAVQNDTTLDNQPRRARSMLQNTNCVPS